MQKVTLTGVAAWGFVVGLLALAMFIGATIHATMYPPVQYVDCGMCGAHVSEWWYVQGADGSPCEVCEHCYLICFE